MAIETAPWKRVWLTGASTGIGEALALKFVQQGMTVFACARGEVALKKLKERCQPLAGELVPVKLDITDYAQIQQLVDLWDTEASWPDLVVLNAGTHDPFPAQKFTAQRAKALLDVNLQGTLNCLDPVLKKAIEHNHGHIAVMASVAGYSGLPTAAIYGASKAALIHICEALRLDLKDSQVKLQVINPGFVKTPLTDKNDFPMPCLIEAEEAAERIFAGLQSDKFEITFPRRFSYFLKFLRILPYTAYFKLLGRTVRSEK